MADPKRSRFERRLLLTIGVVFVTAIVFNCSGLMFPIWRPTHALDQQLRADLGAGLPGGLDVVRARRVALLDASKFFELKGEPAQLRTLIESLTEAGRVRRWHVSDRDPNNASGIGPRPDWWQPAIGQDVRAIELRDERTGTGYYLYWSPSGQLWVFWFET